MSNDSNNGAAAACDTTLTVAREILSLTVRLPGSETAAGTDNIKRVDYALKAAFDEYVRKTKCARTTDDSLVLTLDEEDFSTASLENFDPSRIIRIEVQDPDDDQIYDAVHTSYDEVRTWRLGGIERTEWYPYTNSSDHIGITRVFGWRDQNNAIVAPLPGKAWKVRLVYWERATSWTIGTSDPDSITINIPSDVIHPVIENGAAYYLLKSVNPAAASLHRQLFEQHIASTRGFYAVTRSIRAMREDYI